MLVLIDSNVQLTDLDTISTVGGNDDWEIVQRALWNSTRERERGKKQSSVSYIAESASK